jgi:hypothetical protein
MCPREDDPLCDSKLEVLAACGLGCVHHLTQGLESEVSGAVCTTSRRGGVLGWMRLHIHA